MRMMLTQPAELAASTLLSPGCTSPVARAHKPPSCCWLTSYAASGTSCQQDVHWQETVQFTSRFLDNAASRVCISSDSASHSDLW